MKKLLILVSLLFVTGRCTAQDFITRWIMNNPGSAPGQLSFGVVTSGPCSYAWETVPAGQNGSGTFSGTICTITNLPTTGFIELRIDTTNFRQFRMAFGPDTGRLYSVEQWGKVHWSNMDSMFAGCRGLSILPTDTPDLSQVSSMEAMFYLAFSKWFNYPWSATDGLVSWNTSNVTNMRSLFRGCLLWHLPLDNWNVSAVTDMSYMFAGVQDFIGNNIQAWDVSSVVDMSHMFAVVRKLKGLGLQNWDVSSVTNMSNMFWMADSFQAPIGLWDVSNVTTMKAMFCHATKFNQPIGQWDVSNVTDMSLMFSENVFNQPIDLWDVSKVETMDSMFFLNVSFNQPIGNWDVSHVKTMKAMFFGDFFVPSRFDQPIVNWDVSNVTAMDRMFKYSLFNQPIGGWNVSGVKSMNQMLYGDTVFNQAIGNWDVSNVDSMHEMFNGASRFNQPIGNWNVSNVSAMDCMLCLCSDFNQPLGNWLFKPQVSTWCLFCYSGVDCSNYSQTLMGWAANPQTPSSIVMQSDRMYGLPALAAHDYLVNTKGWTLVDQYANGNCWPLGNAEQEVEVQHIGSFYPNPAQDISHLDIACPSTNELAWQLSNLQGQVLRRQDLRLNPGTNRISVPLHSLASGLYIVTLELNGKRYVKRLEVGR